MDATEEEDFVGGVYDGAGLVEADEPVQILTLAVGGVEVADAVKGAWGEEAGGHGEGEAGGCEELFREPVGALDARFEEVAGAAHEAIDFRVAEEVIDLPGCFVRDPEVVGIEEGDEVAVAEGEAGVAGCAGTLIGLADADDLREGLGDGGAGVGGAVVDDDDFEGAIVLGEDAFDGLADVFLGVVDGDDDGDEWGGHAGSLVWSWRSRARMAMGVEAKSQPRAKV